MIRSKDFWFAVLGHTICIAGAFIFLSSLRPIMGLLYWTHFSNVTWSPDSQYLAFSVSNMLHDDLYIVDNDGHNLRQIDSQEHIYNNLSWSEDSQQLLYNVVFPKGRQSYRVDFDGRNKQHINETVYATYTTTTSDPDFPSPDRNWLASEQCSQDSEQTDAMVLRCSIQELQVIDITTNESLFTLNSFELIWGRKNPFPSAKTIMLSLIAFVAGSVLAYSNQSSNPQFLRILKVIVAIIYLLPLALYLFIVSVSSSLLVAIIYCFLVAGLGIWLRKHPDVLA